MKINSVNSLKLSFGSVIRVDSITNSEHGYSNKVDKYTYEVSKVLNGKKSNIYSKKESKGIRNFFKTLINDYNGKNGVFMTRSLGDVYLCTGVDAKEIKSFYKKGKEKIKDINKNKKNSNQNITSDIFSVKLEYNKLLKERHYLYGSQFAFFNSTKVNYKNLSNEQILGDEKISGKIDNFSYYNKERLKDTAQIQNFNFKL